MLAENLFELPRNKPRSKIDSQDNLDENPLGGPNYANKSN
jgi:hypothetical protein